MIWTIPSTTLKLSILNSTLTNTPLGHVGKSCPALRHDGTRRNLSHLAGLCSTNYPEGASGELRLHGVLGNSCRLSPMKIAPVPSQQPVVHTVLIGSPLLVVLRSDALVTHPDLLHHPARGRVAPQVLRVDAVHP